MIDLRSDTVTKPTPAMLEAIIQAKVGDDVFEEDPTVNAFQQKTADLFGMEAGLFTPSGVMSNQLALKVLSKPGEELITEASGHMFNYESTSAAVISGVQIHPVQGEKGKLWPGLISGALRAGLDWEAVPSVVVVEHSTNKGGGACYSREELLAIKKTADEYKLKLHLDGARIWNAITATGVETTFFSSIADTITVSFSKGLGAPAGSMLLSSAENIRCARRFRKMLGGGMRQIGLLAAAADYAVEHHWPLLAEDHRRAKALAETIEQCPGLTIDRSSVETNILVFDVAGLTADKAVALLKEKGIGLVAFGPQTLRATFHFQIDDNDLETVQQTFRELFS